MKRRYFVILEKPLFRHVATVNECQVLDFIPMPIDLDTIIRINKTFHAGQIVETDKHYILPKTTLKI